MSYLPKEGKRADSFPDYSKYFYDFLKIPETEIFKQSKQERVKQILIIIAGTMGIGKTTLIENIINNLRKHYGIEKTNTVYSQVSAKVLMEYGFKGNPMRGWDAEKPIQILVFDDATSARLTKNDQRQFCKMRHQMMDDTKLTEGVIFSILVTHDWYRLDPNFRRNAIVTAFLSVSPLDQYSRREYGRILGEEGVHFLSERLSKSLRFDKDKGTGLVVLPFVPPGERSKKVGCIKWKNIQDVNYIVIKELPSGRLVWKEKVKQK